MVMQQQIQRDVHKAGENEEVQGSGGVTHGPEDAAAHIVDQQTGNAADVDLQVGGGLIKDVRRGIHKPQHGLHRSYAADGEEDAEQEGGGHGSFHRNMELFHIPGTEGLGDHDAGAGGEAVEEEYHHVHDHGGGTHRSQGLLADKIAHHDGVYGVVEHLEGVAQHQRQGKENDLTENGTAGHVTGGGFLGNCHGYHAAFWARFCPDRILLHYSFI